MEMPQNIQHQLAQFQQMQQQAQAITMQKQSVDLQIRETEKALEELEKVEENAEVYKTAGNLLIKMGKVELTEELTEKLETLKLRENSSPTRKRVMSRLKEMQESLQEAMQMQPSMGN